MFARGVSATWDRWNHDPLVQGYTVWLRCLFALRRVGVWKWFSVQHLFTPGIVAVIFSAKRTIAAFPFRSGDNEVPSRLASDRPIKNVIGSVNQISAAAQGVGWQVGGWERGGGWGGTVTGQQEECREREREAKREREQCEVLPQALSHCYRRIQLLCFLVCLYQGQGVTICLCL